MTESTMLVICVNYNNDDETASFIRTLLTQKTFNGGKILLVNNGESVNKILAELCSEQQRIHFYQADNNLGYLGGAWWGLQKYIEKHSIPEWTIVSNTDIYFPDSDVFEKLIQYHSNEPPAVIAPDIILHSSDNKSLIRQNPHLYNRPSKNRLLFYKFIYKYYLFGLIYGIMSRFKLHIRSNLFMKNNMMNAKENTDTCKEVYAPMGAFIIINRKYFDVGGTLFHGCLLFGEEISVAETAFKLGQKVVYDPRLRVIHMGHGATSLIASRQKMRYKSESAQYCYNRLFGESSN
ncbi:glycosyltransferase [Gemmatimonadota bacterium]